MPTVSALLGAEEADEALFDVVEPGALDAWTEINTSPKLKRFRDERG